MNQIRFLHFLIAGSLAALSACSNAATGPQILGLEATSAKALSSSFCSRSVYVVNRSNNTITVYSQDTGKLAATITLPIKTTPWQWFLGLDARCDLYATRNCSGYTGDQCAGSPKIYIYKGSSYALTTFWPKIKSGKSIYPSDMIVDSSGRMVLAWYEPLVDGGVLLYKPYTTDLYQHNALKRALAVATTSDGKSCGLGTVLRSGKEVLIVAVWNRNGSLYRQIKVTNPGGVSTIAVDQQDHLYIASSVGVSSSAKGYLYEYDLNGSVLRSIHNIGITATGQIAFDSAGNVYAADSSGTGSVKVFGPTGTRPLRTISRASLWATSVALDVSGNLYVASLPKDGSGAVYEFAANSSRLIRTIKQGIAAPTMVSVGGS